MFQKIVKAGGEQPDELEKAIGEALLELEVNSDLKNQLRELYITSAKVNNFWAFSSHMKGGRNISIMFLRYPLSPQCRV